MKKHLLYSTALLAAVAIAACPGRYLRKDNPPAARPPEARLGRRRC